MNLESTPSVRSGPRKGSSGVLRGLMVTSMTLGLFFFGFVLFTIAYSRGQPLLDEVLLPIGDVPAGYVMDPDLSGELTDERMRLLGASSGWSEIASSVSGWSRVWNRPDAKEQVRILVFNTGDGKGAAIAVESMETSLRSSDSNLFEVPSIAGAIGAELKTVAGSEEIQSAVVGFARGSLFFVVGSVQPGTTDAKSVIDLAIQLAERQNSRAGDQYSADVPSTDADYARTFGGLSVVVLLYFFGVFYVANRSDPMRPPKGKPQQFPLAYTLPHSEGRAFDVGPRAKILQAKATRLFVLEVGCRCISDCRRSPDFGHREHRPGRPCRDDYSDHQGDPATPDVQSAG